MSSKLNMQHGNEYRLDIFTTTLVRRKPEFYRNSVTARKRMEQLRKEGYFVSFFIVGENGELVSV